MSALAHAFADIDDAQLPPAVEPERAEWQLAGDEPQEQGVRQAAAIIAMYPVTRLGDRQLARPIVVTLESDEHEVIMNSPRLRIWGSGADAYEAYRDFVSTFFSVLESYQSSTDLTPEAIEYRRALESCLR